jgi:hypothetical protein
MTANACCADISKNTPALVLRPCAMERPCAMDDVDMLTDIAGVKRASEGTEAAGAPDRKLAKSDDGACMSVCV